jgi:hypothetical protein
MDKVQTIDRSNTASSSKTFRDELRTSYLKLCFPKNYSDGETLFRPPKYSRNTTKNKVLLLYKCPKSRFAEILSCDYQKMSDVH